VLRPPVDPGDKGALAWLGRVPNKKENKRLFSPSGFLVRGLGNFLFAPPIRASWFRVLRLMDCQSPVVGLLAVILGPESRDCSVGKILIFSLVLVLDKMHG